MFRILTLLHTTCLLALPFDALAQDADIEPDVEIARHPVGPPILYSGYFWSTDSDIDTGGSMSFEQLLVRMPLFIIGRDQDFFVTGSLKYEYTDYFFDQFELLPDLDVHAARARLTGYFEPDDSPWMGYLRFEPGLYTDGKAIDGDDYQSRALGAIGYRWSPTLSFVLGAYYTESYGDPSLIPAAGFIWQPNDQFVVHLAPPEPRISYYPTADWALHINGTAGGGSWNLDPETSSVVDQMIHTNFRLGAGVERRLYKNLWATLWGGANLFQSLELQDERERSIFDEDIDPSYYIYVGFHIAAW